MVVSNVFVHPGDGLLTMERWREGKWCRGKAAAAVVVVVVGREGGRGEGEGEAAAVQLVNAGSVGGCWRSGNGFPGWAVQLVPSISFQ